MGDFSQYFDIILFAMVAGFLILRLRSVLGRRTGNERRRDPFMRRPGAPGQNVVSLQPPPTASAPSPTAAEGGAGGLDEIHAVDPSFDPAHFLEGARAAFEMIVIAFAAGDKARLRPLLSDEVYGQFVSAIDEREAAKEALESRILKLKSSDIIEAGVTQSWARVTVKLASEQINVLRAHDGSIVDGDPANPIEKTDFWTFSRDTRSSDPNWVLIASGSG